MSRDVATGELSSLYYYWNFITEKLLLPVTVPGFRYLIGYIDERTHIFGLLIH